MLYNGILYKHIHPTLIFKDLFDECQEVRSGRRKTKSKRTQQPFVLKGMKIPQHILKDVADELKKSSDKEHQHQVFEGVRLQQQNQTLQTRIKRARELYIDASIARRI